MYYNVYYKKKKKNLIGKVKTDTLYTDGNIFTFQTRDFTISVLYNIYVYDIIRGLTKARTVPWPWCIIQVNR